MEPKRTPPLLRAWMLFTWCFAFPISVVSWTLHRRMGADPKRFSERLGRGAPQRKDTVVWFHAASLGEVMQIAPLAQHLAQSEQTQILVTTTTATGADWVAKQMPFAIHRFAPIDTPATIRRFLDGWSISAAIFVEGDLWPRLLEGLRKRDVPQILLNARHSRTRARFPAVFGVLLSGFSVVTCRSEPVAKGMLALGLSADNVHVMPDLRLTVPKLAVSSDALSTLTRAVGTRPVWLAASTHPADEEAVLTAQQTVLEVCPDALLILAPRHPNRALPLLKQAESLAFGTAQRSLGQGVSDATQIYIADTFGELGTFFKLAPIAFLGGSFGQEGGHNPYEPAHFETAIVHGPHVKNFADAYEALRLREAAVQVQGPEGLGQVIVGLLQDDQAKAMGQAGLAFVENAKQGTLSYANLIATVLKRT
ncbi:MAG: glycosyltransferase N-terminal domain-containing protein [Tateyamaria sp.]|uniref:3-deoxy-D-manno-octulosonic acid transferase n=1 Tax=Tateyamaria sp. TaxID=1929288 RepID=UPI00329C9657